MRNTTHPRRLGGDRHHARPHASGGGPDRNLDPRQRRHGARPHQAIDPVLVAGHIITAAQSVVARNLSAFEQGVVSICSMHGGHPGAMSVIPGEVTLVGTVRTYSETVQDLIEERLRSLCQGIAQGLGLPPN